MKAFNDKNFVLETGFVSQLCGKDADYRLSLSSDTRDGS